MKLIVGGEDNKTVEATPDAIEAALREVGSKLDFMIIEDGPGTYMQTDGAQLEYRETELGQFKHFRAYVDYEDALRAFVAYAAGSDEWRGLCDWKDVTLEFVSRPVTLALIIVAALAAAGVFLWLVL